MTDGVLLLGVLLMLHVVTMKFAALVIVLVSADDDDLRGAFHKKG